MSNGEAGTEKATISEESLDWITTEAQELCSRHVGPLVWGLGEWWGYSCSSLLGCWSLDDLLFQWKLRLSSTFFSFVPGKAGSKALYSMPSLGICRSRSWLLPPLPIPLSEVAPSSPWPQRSLLLGSVDKKAQLSSDWGALPAEAAGEFLGQNTLGETQAWRQLGRL